MSCAEFHAEIWRRLDAGLPPPAPACAHERCRGYAARAARLDALIPSALEPASAPALAAAVLARIREQDASRGPAPGAVVGACALALAALTGGIEFGGWDALAPYLPVPDGALLDAASNVWSAFADAAARAPAGWLAPSLAAAIALWALSCGRLLKEAAGEAEHG